MKRALSLLILCSLLASSAGADPSNQTVLSQMAAPYARTTAEISAGVTPANYGYAPGNSMRFAKCDGVTDDTTALQHWAATAFDSAHLVIQGSCLFKSPITFPLNKWVTLEGNGKGSQLLYAGTATTGTIVSIGGSTNGNGCSVTGWTIRNLRLTSNTVMTGGDALWLGQLCEAELQNLYIGGDLGGNTNWYNALHIVAGNSIHLRGYDFVGSNAGEIVNGVAYPNTTPDYVTDLFQEHGKIAHSTIGLILAGAVGGFILDTSDLLSNGTNVRIDQSQYAQPNTQLFFGIGFTSDITSGGAGIGVDLADAATDPTQSVLTFTGSWLASTQPPGGQCLYVKSTASNWSVNILGGNVLNCQSDGVRIDSTSAKVNITGTRFQANVLHSVNLSVTNTNVNVQGIVSTDATPFTGITNYTKPGSVVSAGNQIINSSSGTTTAIGPSGGNGIWVQGGLVIPGSADAATAGGTTALGSGSFPFSALVATAVTDTNLTTTNITSPSGVIVFTGGPPIWDFDATGGGADTKHFLAGPVTGTFKLSSATDAAPSTRVTDALAFNRSGTAWTSLTFGNSTDNPSYAFSGTGTVTFNGPIALAGQAKLPVTTVSGLPTCNSGAKGALYAVSDATAPTYNAALTGGGAVSVPVFCNGTSWVSH